MVIKEIGESKLYLNPTNGKLCIKIFDTEFWVTDSDLEEMISNIKENSQPIKKVEVFFNKEKTKFILRVERENLVQRTKVLSTRHEIDRAIKNIARNEKELELITNEVNSKLR